MNADSQKKALTLRQVLGISYLLGTILMAVVITLLVRNELSTQLRQDLLNNGITIAQQLAKDSQIALIQRAAENVQTSVAMARHFPNVEAVGVYTVDGKSLIESTLPAQSTELHFSQDTARLIEENQRHMVIIAPVVVTTYPPTAENPFGAGGGSSQRDLLGFVSITVSKAAMQMAVKVMEKQLLTLIILVATGIFTATMVLVHWITHPLKQLARVMMDRATPTQHAQAPVYGIQEAREMAFSFNALMASFAAVNEELIQVNEALESRVEERTNELMQANRALQAISEAKSEFLSRMSHELRTPLQAVITGADLLLNTGPLRPEQSQWANIIHSSTYLLLDMVNDVLDLSRLEAGKLMLERNDFDLHRVLHGVIMTLSLPAAEKGLRLAVDVDPQTPYRLCGDATRLSQILMNLLGNAVKFTHQGYVKLKVHSVHDTANRVTVRFDVMDTGIGIPEEAQHRIFDYFTQADESVARHYGGAGLGATLTKRLVELMGSRLELDSEVGKGSHFWFDAPFEKSAATERTSTAPALPGLQVLIISADTQASAAWTGWLQQWGVTSRTAPDGEQALPMLHDAQRRRQPFTTLLVDERRVCPSADAFAHAVLSSTSGSSVSLILLIPAHVMDHRDAYLEAGYTAVLIQPVNPEVLYGALRLTREVMHRPSGAVTSARVIQPVAGSLRILLAEDNPTTQLVLGQLLDMAGHRLCIAGDGEQALNLLDTQAFDLAIIDLQMPVLDGHEVIVRYRRQHPDSDLPMLVLTADTTKTGALATLEAHIDAVLTKPISSETLLEAIDKHGRRPPSGRFHGQASRTKPSLPAPSLTSADWRVLRTDTLQLLQRKKPVMAAKLASTYLQDTARYLEQIETALAHRQWDALKRAAHGLRSATAAMGAEQVMALCIQIGQESEQKLPELVRQLRLKAAEANNALTSYLQQDVDEAPMPSTWPSA